MAVWTPLALLLAPLVDVPGVEMVEVTTVLGQRGRWPGKDTGE